MNTRKTELLQGIPALFDAAWDSYKHAFIKLLKVNWLPVLIGGYSAAVFAYISGIISERHGLDLSGLISILAVLIGTTVVSLVASSLAYVAQIKVLEEQGSLEKPSIANDSANSDESVSAVGANAGTRERSIIDIYKESAPMMVPYIWVTALTTLAILGGFVLLIVPGIVCAVWFSFAPFAYIAEGDRGAEALRKSKAYVRGIWAPVFYRYLALVGFMILVGIAGGIAKKFLATVLNLDSAGEMVLNFAYQLVIAPYFLIYIYEMYRDAMRVTRELAEEEGDADNSAAGIAEADVETPGM